MDGTVLVADDDRTIRTVLTQALTRAGCKVHATGSLGQLMRWVDEGRGDDWIAQELNTTPSSVQSFRSRNSIYRRDPVRRGNLSEHPAVLEADEAGFRLETEAVGSEVFRDEWREHLDAAPEELRVVVTRERIYVEKTR